MSKLESHQAFRARQAGNGEVILVRGGKRAYLWFEGDLAETSNVGSLSGAATLRRLARAILKEVGTK